MLAANGWEGNQATSTKAFVSNSERLEVRNYLAKQLAVAIRNFIK